MVYFQKNPSNSFKLLAIMEHNVKKLNAFEKYCVVNGKAGFPKLFRIKSASVLTFCSMLLLQFSRSDVADV